MSDYATARHDAHNAATAGYINTDREFAVVCVVRLEVTMVAVQVDG